MKQGFPEEIFLSCWRPDSMDYDGIDISVTAWITTPGGYENLGLGTVRKVSSGLFAYTPTPAETMTSRFIVRLKAPGMITSPKEVEFTPANAPAPDLKGKQSISRYRFVEITAGITPAPGHETWVSALLELGDSIPLTGRFLDGLQKAYPGVFDELTQPPIE